MCLGERVGDETFGAAQTFGEADEPDAREDGAGERFAAGGFADLEGDHGARAVGLAAVGGISGMIGQAGIVNPSDFRAECQPAGDFAGAGLLFCDTHGEGFQTAHDQPAVERGERRAGGQPDESQFVGEFRGTGNQYAGDGVVVAGDVFCRTVQDDVRAERDRALENGGQESVVHDQQEPVLFRQFGDGGDVAHMHERVGRRFDEYRAGFRADQGADVVDVGGGRAVECDTVFGGYTREQAERAAVKVVGGDDVLARRKQFHDGGSRGHAGGEGQRGRAVVEFRHGRFQRVTGRVGVAGVVVAGAFARRGVGECGGLVNRDGDGTACVGAGRSAMDAEGVLFHSVSCHKGFSAVSGVRKQGGGEVTLAVVGQECDDGFAAVFRPFGQFGRCPERRAG